MGRGTRYRFGLETVNSSIAVGDDLTVADDMTVSGTFSEPTSLGTETDFAVGTTNFTVAAATGNTVIAGTLAVTGASTLTGAVSCGSTLATTGAATLASLVCTAAGTFGGGYGATGVTISTAGNIQANGTLTVDGASTLTGNVTASGTLAVTGTSTLTGNVSCGGTLASTGAATLASLVCTAAGTFGGGYGSAGCTIATTGNIQTNGTLTVDGTSTLTGAVTITGALDVAGGFTTDTNAFAIADTTGVITMKGGATLDNNAVATTLTITETNIGLAGAVDVTGAFTVATNKLSIAAATGIITMNEGATIDNDTGVNTLTITETTITLVGAVGVTGALDVTGGFTTDTNAFAIADTTGVITMKGGATLDNNAAATTLTITETNIGLTGAVTVTGALDVTGGFTTDTNAFAIADTTGVLTLKGGATIDNNADAAILNLTETTVRATGAFNVTGAVTLDSTLAVTGAATFTAACKTGAGLGGAAGTGVTAVEYGDGNIHKTVFTFTNVDVVLADNAGVVAYGGLKVYDFPAGAILFLGATTDFDLTKSSAGVNADWDGDIAVGTVTATNDASLATTEQNIIPTTATPQAVAGATTGNAQSTATQNAVVDGTTTAVDAYVNILVDDADHDVTSTPCNIIVNGTMTIAWINLGDY